MAVFPMFVELKEKNCIVVGGGEIARRKVEILLRYEAKLTVIAPEISSSIKELENLGKIYVLSKEYAQQDTEDAFLIVAATSSPKVNDNVYRDAVKRNIPVNVVDDSDKCTFIFPSVVKRGDFSIGISTSGNYPALAKKARKLVETMFPEEYSEILALLAGYRSKVRSSNLSQNQKEKELVQVLEEFYHKGVITTEAMSSILEEHEKLF